MFAPHFQASWPPARRVRREGVAQLADYLFDGIANQLGPATVRAEDAPLGADDPISIGCVLEEIAIALLALAKPLLGPQPLELGGRTSSEDPQDEQPPRFRGHGPLVIDREGPQDMALAVRNRHGHVTFGVA